MFKIPSGSLINFDQSFVIGTEDNAVTYPPNWLRQATPEERAEIGIVEQVQQVRADDKFYFVSDNGDGTSTAIERPLEQVKAALVAQIKVTARSMLAQTSWYIERLMDPTSNEPVPQTVLDEREEIRARADELEAQINACQSIPTLAAVQITWPSAEIVVPA